MRAVHPVAEVRAAEAAAMAALPPGALMARAASGLARRCAALLPAVYGARVVLLVGAGNNGADALWAGARLAARGARVDALLVGAGEPEALAAFAAAGGRSRPAGPAPAPDGPTPELLRRADLVVDGLVGIGGRGPLRPAAAALAGLLAAHRPAVVVAVDLPSGVDADTGAVGAVAVRADVTVTFGTHKPGLLVSPGAQYAGMVECVDIGLDPYLPVAHLAVLDAGDVAARLPTPVGEASKYTRGVLGVAAGSETYTGAAVLATGGALRTGAGMVRYAGTPHPAEQVRSRWPESVVTAAETGAEVVGVGRVQAWVVGPGLGTGDRAAGVVQAVLGQDVPVLVDADGLTVLARHGGWLTGRAAPTLLTPHAGEFARLMGCERADVEADRLTWARRAAAELGVTVLLKGTTTVVADPDGSVRINPTGTPWLATAGSGDVLSGACGALLAGGLSALDAGSCGAFLHGLAARLAGAGAAAVGTAAGAPGPAPPPVPITATDLLAAWSAAERAVRAPTGPDRRDG